MSVDLRAAIESYLAAEAAEKAECVNAVLRLMGLDCHCTAAVGVDVPTLIGDDAYNAADFFRDALDGLPASADRRNQINHLLAAAIRFNSA